MERTASLQRLGDNAHRVAIFNERYSRSDDFVADAQAIRYADDVSIGVAESDWAKTSGERIAITDGQHYREAASRTVPNH